MTNLIRQTLSNGTRVLLEPMAGRHSVAIQVLLGVGSRHEGSAENGMSHFCEHLLFKGTGRQNWQELSRAISMFGGSVNASTNAESVRLYGTFAAPDFSDALALLAGMFLDSTFPDREVAREREVILEEIAEYEDMPDDVAFEQFNQALLLPHPAGRPVIGTERLVGGFTAKQLRAYWQRALTPERLIVSIAGAIEPAFALRQVQALFRGLRQPAEPLDGEAPMPGHSEVRLLHRPLEQVNFAFGTTGPAKDSPRRFAWALYDTILGSGWGSRLFDEVREQRGLAYSIGSSLTLLRGGGLLAITGSTRPDHAEQAVAVCREQVCALARDGATEEEVRIAKRQLARAVMLGDEHVETRCGRHAERELYGLEHQTVEETLQHLEAVTPEEIQAVAREVKGFGPPAACAVGPLRDEAKLRAVLGAP